MAELLLVGNANTGKTTLFNKLTHSRERASNWDGVTVECKNKTIWHGENKLTVFDLPGIDSLLPVSKDEIVSANELKQRCSEGAYVCIVCDASNLKKNLGIAVELKSLGVKFDVAINMINEVKGNFDLLKSEIEKIFGCACFLIDARKRRFVRQIKTHFLSADEMSGNEKIDNAKKHTSIKNAQYSDKVIDNCIKKCKIESPKMERTEKLLLNKFVVLPLFFALFCLLFWIAFGPVGNWLSWLIEKYFVDLVLGGFARWGYELNNVLGVFIDQVVVFGSGSVICFVPQILILYVGMSLFENVGLLARVAFVVDPFFRKIGLSGRSVFSLLSGFGCTTSAVLVTRNLESAKIRKRTTLALPFFGCSAKLPVLLVVASLFFEKCKFLCVLGVYLLSILVFLFVFLIVGLFSHDDKVSMFVRLPKLRFPDFGNIVGAATSNIVEFFRRTFATVLLLCCGLFLLNNFTFSLAFVEEGDKSILQIIGETFAPVFAPLGFGSWGVVVALVFGLVAKEMLLSSLALVNMSSIALLFESLVCAESVVHFSAASSLSFLTFIMLFTPCVPSLRMIAKEIDGKWAVFVGLFQFVVAYVASLFVFEIARGNFVFLWILIGIVVAFFTAVVIKCRAYGGFVCNGCCDKNCARGRSNKII